MSTAVLSVVKAQAVAQQYPLSIVIGADTVVELDGVMMGKPKDEAQAREMLTALSDKTHTVHTGIALCCRGEVRYAVVYNPFIEDLFAAEKGCGATLNGRPIYVSDHDAAHAICMCGSTIYDRSYTDRSFAIMRWLYDHTLDFRRFGSAELDICQVAAGRIEIFFECRLSPWDFAAGSLILQEAGGSLTRLDGSAIDPREPGSVWATNGKCHEMYRELP